MMEYLTVNVDHDGEGRESWSGTEDLGSGREIKFTASPSLSVISLASRHGMEYADVTGSNDWSFVRDGSNEQTELLLCRALNYLLEL